MFNENDPIVRTAVFGKQVENFLSSEIGKYLTDRADLEIKDAMHELVDVNPMDPTAVMRLQAKIGNAKQFKQWLMDAYHAGQQALNILEDEQ